MRRGLIHRDKALWADSDDSSMEGDDSFGSQDSNSGLNVALKRALGSNSNLLQRTGTEMSVTSIPSLSEGDSEDEPEEPNQEERRINIIGTPSLVVGGGADEAALAFAEPDGPSAGVDSAIETKDEVSETSLNDTTTADSLVEERGDDDEKQLSDSEMASV